MIGFSGDFKQANKLLDFIISQANNSNKFLNDKGSKLLAASNKNSFRQQRSPDGTNFEKSTLSQIDPTGSPRMTMIRSTTLFQDTQDMSNYKVSGDTLEEYTTAASESGFLYGEYHNNNRWWFAGFDLENTEKFQSAYIDYVFGINNA